MATATTDQHGKSSSSTHNDSRSHRTSRRAGCSDTENSVHLHEQPCSHRRVQHRHSGSQLEAVLTLTGLPLPLKQLRGCTQHQHRPNAEHIYYHTYIGQTPQHPLVQHIGHTPQHPLVNLCNPVLHTTGLIIQYRHRVHAIATRIAPSHLTVHTDNCQTHCHTSHTVHIYTQGHTAHYIRSGL